MGTRSDDDGNLTRALDPLYGGEMVLNYNSRNWVIGGTVKGRGASYEYDAEGHRVSETVNGVRTRYVVNPEAGLSQVLVREVEGVPSGANGKRCWSVWGHGLIYEVETATGTGGSGVGVEKLRVHHYDQVGNTVVVTDEAQRDVLWVRYDVYGAVTHAESPAQRDGGGPVRADLNGMADKLDRALAVTPYLYGGQQGVMTDGNGLVHMRARYYHPGIRRFVNADPIGFEGGMNWYGYANGDPVMRSDPSGNVTQNIYAQFQYSGVDMSAFSQGYFDARTGNGVASPEYYQSSYLAGMSAFQSSSYAAQGYSSLAASMNSVTQLHVTNAATEARPGSGLDMHFAIMGGVGPFSGERVSGITSLAFGKPAGTPASVLAGIQVFSWGTSPPPGDYALMASANAAYIGGAGINLTYRPGYGLSGDIIVGAGAGYGGFFGVGKSFTDYPSSFTPAQVQAQVGLPVRKCYGY